MEFPSGSDHNKEMEAPISSTSPSVVRPPRVGLVYDSRMCKHSTPSGRSHPENPKRIIAIWKKLLSAGIPKRCVVSGAKRAKNKHIAAVHAECHIDLIKTINSEPLFMKTLLLQEHSSIYVNEGSSEAAYLAAGSVIEVAEKVAKGELNSAFAIVRPPGHHAQEAQSMGFCLFNNVAIAARFLLDQKELGINKILIVDWDVHHGNGTQRIFWEDSRVLYFSVHRYEYESFYPCDSAGSYFNIGDGEGEGYNINVPWENGWCGDPDYMAVWDHILIPVAREYNPDIILISAGFDAAIDDPLGGCCVTPYGYSVMLKKLMEFGNGKIVMALEGGYNLNSLANSVLACMETLLEEKPIFGSLEFYPFQSTWEVIHAVREELKAYWPILSEKLPEELTTKTTPRAVREELTTKTPPQVQSNSEYDNGPQEELQEDLSKLKVEDNHDQITAWRSELSNVDVWYASFGSNLSLSRFSCYIEGGQEEGMHKPCQGAVDKSPPKDIMWKIVPHRLFFGYGGTDTSDPSGVAYLDPEESNDQDKAYLCLYRITLEQFNDVLLQENVLSDPSSPFFDLNDLRSIEHEKCIEVDVPRLQDCCYNNVVYLGKENDIPVLTMTCTSARFKGFIKGRVGFEPPAKDYEEAMVRGLVQGTQLSKEEAIAYIHENVDKPLRKSKEE